ncbi:MAG TPA: hypothetical protein VIP46_02280 [Pyrinomonadaceae bacterium]
MKTDEHTATPPPPSQPPAAEPAACDEPRIHGPFPARVRGRDASGVRFKVSTQLEDISAGHCYVRLDRDARRGGTLFITTQINRAVVMLRGTVLNVSPRPGGVHCTSVKIVSHRFVTRQSAPEIA